MEKAKTFIWTSKQRRRKTRVLISDSMGASLTDGGDNPVTVCIAVMCNHEQSQSVVVASDRMITVGFPNNIEFDHDTPKHYRLNLMSLALVAGNALRHNALIRTLRTQLGDSSDITMEDVAEKLKVRIASPKKCTRDRR